MAGTMVGAWRVPAALAVLLAAGCGDGAVPPPPPAPAPPATPSPPSVAPLPAPPRPSPDTDADLLLPFETEQDPPRARTLRAVENLRLDPLFVGRRMVIRTFGPFLLAMEGERMEAGDDGPAGIAGRGLMGAYGRFRRFFRDHAAVELPLLEEGDDPGIQVILLRDRASFDAWHGTAGLPRESNPYFGGRGGGRILTWREQATESGIGQPAIHALRLHYALPRLQAGDDAEARKRGKPIERVDREDSRLGTAFAWFQTGLARELSVERAAGEGFRGEDADALKLLRRCRWRDLAWPLEEFLFEDRAAIRSRAKVRDAGSDPELLVACHGVQGWILLRTLLDGGGGRWRAGSGEFLHNEIDGVSGRSYLLEAFGLPKSPSDPKVAAWIAEVEAACLETEAAMTAGIRR